MIKEIKWEKLDLFSGELDEVDISEGGMIDLAKLRTQNKFNFWIGHTNFRITERNLMILDGLIDGIESLAIVSPFRFIISVGQLFNEYTVKNLVEKNLCAMPFVFDSTTEENINKLQEQLKIYEDWAIYVLPNTSLEYAILEKENKNKTEFETQLEIFQHAEQRYGGMILKPIK